MAVLAVMVLVAVLPAGGPPAQPAGGLEPVGRLAWTPVRLPAGMVPTAIATGGSSLVVGAQAVPSGEPRLAVSTDAQSWHPLPVAPSTVKGPISRWTRLAVAGGEVAGLGASSGGAHGILRWTVWRGDTATGLRELPQPFETFGGPDAGTLADIALVDGRHPVVLGSWTSSEAGFDVSLWEERSGLFVRGGWTGAPLHSTRARFVAGVDLEPWRAGALVVGSATVLDGPAVRTGPRLWWSGSHTASWSWVELEGEGSATDGRGYGASCLRRDACWVVGRLDEDVVAWRVERPDATAPLVARVRAADIGVVSPPLVLGERVLSVAERGSRLAVLDLTAGHVLSGPPGRRLLGAVALGTALQVVTEGADGATSLYAATVVPHDSGR